MNKRNLNLRKYGISKGRYKELCGICEQYPEWVEMLKEKTDTLKSKTITDMPLPPVGGNSDPTGTLAIRRYPYSIKCMAIDKAARLAGEDMWEYIIKSVCYAVPLNYLLAYENMPMEKSAFYEMRRYFFYLLDKTIDEQ